MHKREHVPRGRNVTGLFSQSHGWAAVTGLGPSVMTVGILNIALRTQERSTDLVFRAKFSLVYSSQAPAITVVDLTYSPLSLPSLMF